MAFILRIVSLHCDLRPYSSSVMISRSTLAWNDFCYAYRKTDRDIAGRCKRARMYATIVRSGGRHWAVPGRGNCRGGDQLMGSHDNLIGRLNGQRSFGRRDVLRGTAAVAVAGLAAPAVMMGRARADGVVLNFASYGGVLNDYLTKLFAVPFEKETGIRVNFGGNASLALAKLQTTSGTSAQWDLINLTGAEYLAAIDENIIVPYDYSIVDASHIEPEFKGTHGIKFSLYLFGMGYDKRK